MKVTVCFGNTKVVVPVGDGRDVFVRDLIDAAVIRYKRATNKGSDSQVRVRNLRLANESGGILDPDDSLLAVVDDKEQIVAIYDEQESTWSGVENGTNAKTNGHSATLFSNNSRLHSNAASSSLRRQSSKGSENVQRQNGVALTSPASSATTAAEKNSVVVDEDSTAGASCSVLLVRRGSEPVLNAAIYADDTSHGAGIVKRRVEFLNAELKDNQRDEETSPTTENAKGQSSRFSRTAARKSRLTDEWLEVAAQAAEEYRAKTISDDKTGRVITLQPHESNRISRSGALVFEPEYETKPNQLQILRALTIKRVPETAEADSEALRVGDKIVEINGHAVSKMTFEKTVDYFYQVCDGDDPVTLNIRPCAPPKPTSFPRQLAVPGVPTAADATHPQTDPNSKQSHSASKPSASLVSIAPMAALQKGNTRRIGQRIHVDLIKKPPPDGFGFTLTSRDIELVSAATSESGQTDALVYVKTIFPKGAAIEDGRLRAGDRLLEVNGVKVSKKFGQPEVVNMLRMIKPGDVANLVLSRQTVTVTDGEYELAEKRVSPSLPRPLKENAEMEEVKLENGDYEQAVLTFDIPLNNTGSAGLGVSVKGRMTADEKGERKDGGIFVKYILHGGAGHKDGRLRVNDRVMAVEGVDLSGLGNEAAMQRLRAVLMELKPTAKSIRLTVLRLMPLPKRDEKGSTGPMDGGQHRLVVNDNGVSKKGITRTYVSHGDSDYAVIVKDRALRALTGVSGVVSQWPNWEDDEPPVMMEWSESVAGGHQPMKASRSDSTGSSWAGERMSRRDHDDDGSTEALFVRDAPTRRSMSEKRHGAARNDPSGTATFQRIQHQRQTSAPSLQRRPTGGGSLMGPTSTRDASGGRSETVGLPADRRSMSLESMHRNQGPEAATVVHTNGAVRKRDKPLLHEEVAQSVLRTSGKSSPGPSGAGVKWLKSKSAAGRQRPTNDSFRQAVDKSYGNGDGVEVGVDVYVEDHPTGYSTQPQEPFYAQIPHSATADAIAAVNRARPVNKEKDRRKSTGSGLSLKNLFRFGSGGKANRPFAVVSPVNNELEREGEDAEYRKMNKRRDQNERHKSLDRERRHATYHDDGSDIRSILKQDPEFERKQQMEAHALARRQHEEEQWRIRQHYERLKEEQMKHQNVHSSDSLGSRSPRNARAMQSKMATQWKPPVPPSSPAQARLRVHPMLGRDVALEVHHARQHSGGGSTGSGGHSPCEYYPQSDVVFQQRVQPSPMIPIDGRDQFQGLDNRRLGSNRNNQPNKSVSPVPQPCWFVDGVGGTSSVRHHRFYYSSMDGRSSERYAAIRRDSPTKMSQACCTNEHGCNVSMVSPCTSPVLGHHQQHQHHRASSSNPGMSNQNQHWNGQHQGRSTPSRHSPGAARIRSPEDGRQRVIIGSVPIFDSTKTDGVTRIVVDSAGHRMQPPPVPPPDYEQYLRSRNAKKGLARGQLPRPCSEFIGDSALGEAKFDSSSLPRKGAKKSSDRVDVVLATPPARNVHYFYHPHQQLK